MAGWNLKNGEITEYCISEDKLWSLFNYVFSDGCKKRNSYKFGLVKSILDNLFNGQETARGVYLSYHDLFAKFTENYWNLVVKYDLRQMRRDGKSEFSKIETILKKATLDNKILNVLEFESIDSELQNQIIHRVTLECKRCVIGALYEDFDGTLYAFDLKESGLYLSPLAHEFMLKYKPEIENLNYYAWAKFLEKVNPEHALVRVIDKLELSTPKRSDLSVYREILRKEFQECNCFYCGKKLLRSVHVDHFIPWAFIKDDKLWNFVLSCASCNEKKNNRVPTKNYLIKLEERNSIIQQADSEFVRLEFNGYSEGLMTRMWQYAKMSGIKEYVIK